MDGTSRITKEAETKIIRALEEAKDDIDNGTRPDDAIYKAADAHNLPAGHVRLMVQAYNTAQTNRVRREHDNILEKAGEFELANAQAVIDRLYPSVTKQAAAVEEVDEIYSAPPRWLDGMRGREKAATNLGLTKKAEAYPREEGRRLAREAAVPEITRKAAEEARRAVSQSRDKVAASFTDLEDYFRRPGCRSFAEVRENSTLLFGKQADRLFDLVAANRKSFCKEASASPNGHPTNLKNSPYREVKATLDAVDDYHQARLARDEFEKALAPEKQATAKEDSLGFMLKQAWLGSVAQGAASTALGSGIRDKLFKSPDSDAAKTDAFRSITSPAHEQKIKSIQMQASLHDMLANDPVISGHQPEDVLKVFNEVQQLAPRAAQTPMLMRALLRKHLSQGQLDMFDVHQLSGIEKTIKDRDEPDYEGQLAPVPGLKSAPKKV